MTRRWLARDDGGTETRFDSEHPFMSSSDSSLTLRSVSDVTWLDVTVAGHLTGFGFRHWVGGLIAEMRRKTPLQTWLDSIPNPAQPDPSSTDSQITPPALNTSTNKAPLSRDASFQASDDLENQSETNGDKLLIRKQSKGLLLRERSTNSEGNTPKTRHPFLRDSSLQVCIGYTLKIHALYTISKEVYVLVWRGGK